MNVQLVFERNENSGQELTRISIPAITSRLQDTVAGRDSTAIAYHAIA